MENAIVFGPVPSRRLGSSLGINNIPAKTCTCSCVYCQVGRTTRLEIERRPFYKTEALVRAVAERIETARLKGTAIDYLTFVADGEPTLDLRLGQAIERLRVLGIPIAVITNANLIARADVRADLACADWVSLKVDAVSETVWRRVDRPHGRLRLAQILAGMVTFAAGYHGELVTETMLVGGLNDDPALIDELGGFVAQLRPAKAYLAIPTRPPAEEGIAGPGEESLTRAYARLSRQVDGVEYLIGYEGNAFAATGCAEQDLLSITAVHPLRQEAVAALLARDGASWNVVGRLVAEGKLAAVTYEGHLFYLRKMPAAASSRANAPHGVA